MNAQKLVYHARALIDNFDKCFCGFLDVPLPPTRGQRACEIWFCMVEDHWVALVRTTNTQTLVDSLCAHFIDEWLHLPFAIQHQDDSVCGYVCILFCASLLHGEDINTIIERYSLRASTPFYNRSRVLAVMRPLLNLAQSS